MSQTDEEFRDAHKPLQVPASYKDAANVNEKVAFALADIGEGSADEVIRRIEALEQGADHKPVIAATRQTLTEWYDNGLIAANDRNGDLIYNLHKITRANEGAVDPNLLAPGLD